MKGQTTSGKDPLLLTARFVLMAFMVIIGIGAVAIAISIPAMFIGQSTILAELAKDGVSLPDTFFPVTALTMLGIIALMAGAIYFLLLLRRIVVSVGHGDPFIADNARRLSRMGWTAVALQVASMPIGGAVHWIADLLKDTGRIEIGAEFGFSGEGLLLVLVLFILARVFRIGAAMRDDLEGTV